jgi:hypothetical protein
MLSKQIVIFFFHNQVPFIRKSFNQPSLRMLTSLSVKLTCSATAWAWLKCMHHAISPPFYWTCLSLDISLLNSFFHCLSSLLHANDVNQSTPFKMRLIIGFAWTTQSQLRNEIEFTKLICGTHDTKFQKLLLYAFVDNTIRGPIHSSWAHFLEMIFFRYSNDICALRTGFRFLLLFSHVRNQLRVVVFSEPLLILCIPVYH